MFSNMIDQWTNFYVAVAGASAALSGLVIVAVSVNVKQIIKYRSLPSRAGATIATLILLLLVAVAGLIPGQSLRALGIEILLFSVAVWTLETIANYQTVLVLKQREASKATAILSVVTGQIQIIPFLIGGALIIMGSIDGLYWVAAGILTVFVVAIINTWVFLVEILR